MRKSFSKDNIIAEVTSNSSDSDGLTVNNVWTMPVAWLLPDATELLHVQFGEDIGNATVRLQDVDFASSDEVELCLLMRYNITSTSIKLHVLSSTAAHATELLATLDYTSQRLTSNMFSQSLHTRDARTLFLVAEKFTATHRGIITPMVFINAIDMSRGSCPSELVVI